MQRGRIKHKDAPAESLYFVPRQLPDDMGAVKKRDDNQANAGKVLEPQEGVFAELSVTARNAEAQYAKPRVRAKGNAADACNLGSKRVIHPVVRHEVRGQQIHVSKTPRLHSTRTKPVINAECGCSFSPSRASIFSEATPSLVGRLKVCAVKNFEPRNKRKTNVKTSIEAFTSECRRSRKSW